MFKNFRIFSEDEAREHFIKGLQYGFLDEAWKVARDNQSNSKENSDKLFTILEQFKNGTLKIPSKPDTATQQ